MPRDSAADLADEVLEAVPRYACIVVSVRLRQVRSHDVHADFEVGLVEVVADVPADLAILAPLLDNSVEERQHEDQRVEG